MKLKLAKWCSIIPLFAYALLAAAVLLEAMSCNYKDRHRNAFYLYVCNDTDMNCELEIAGQMKTAVLSCPAKSWKIERLKIKTTDSADFEARLLTDGKLMDIRGMNFPGGGIQSYSAYGGLCARINIIQRESGAPRIEISDDWDAATEAERCPRPVRYNPKQKHK